MRSEFDFINDIKSRYDLSKVGDDCAVLPKDNKTDLLITSDMLVEGIDFRLEWATPEQIGHKALAVSLSDIAAMGGTPTFAMLSIAIAENLWKTDFLDSFYAGWHKLAGKYGVDLIGGDISRTSGPVVIDCTALGEVPKGRAILRTGARPGDAIYVTRELGGAAGGLTLLEANRRDESSSSQELVRRQLEPMPDLEIGKYLKQQGLVSAGIDLSDGLSSDLMHICRASGVGAELVEEWLPIQSALPKFFDQKECIRMALHGGEDLGLLFTGNPEIISSTPLPSARIGTITADTDVIELISGETRTRLEPRGYRHF